MPFDALFPKGMHMLVVLPPGYPAAPAVFSVMDSVDVDDDSGAPDML